MNKDDLKELTHAFEGLIWLLRANATTFLVFVLGVALFPAQLILWIAGKETFLNTEPYRFLRYLFAKGSAFKWERPIARQSYEEWKQNPPH